MITRLSFLGIVAWLVCTAFIHKTVASDTNEQEAQEIVVLLNKAGIAAGLQCGEPKKKGASKLCSVEIQGGDRTEARARGILQDSGLPRKREVGFAESIQGSSVLATPEETKANLMARLCGELNQTLKEMPGVVAAHVFVVVPEAAPLRPRVPPSGSVFIKHWASIAPPDGSEVKLLVARAVEGLSPDNVGVIYSKLVPSTPDSEPLLLGLLPSPELVLDYAVPFVAMVLVGLLLVRFGPELRLKFDSMALRRNSSRMVANPVQPLRSN